MKPMRLKIKGINSFIEEQTINFDELTQGGLFGIFGPTGSGKSTILDGITLALYGKLSRNSTNYINLNEQKGSVVFEFIISGAEHKNYQVSREFVRNKNGGINQGKCQLLDLSTGLPHVLADRSTEVSHCCEDIIGLSLTDFTRTVVLPQGKFSDFLKLEGKPRREMLERLFNLSKYGEDLTNRVKAEKIRETEKLHRLEGSISAYKGVSPKALEEKTIEFEENHQNLTEQEKEFENSTQSLTEAETLWGYQQELKSVMAGTNELTNKKLKMTEKETQLNQGKKAYGAAPAIEALESLNDEITELSEKLESSKESYAAILAEKNEIEKTFEIIERQKNEDLPKYKEALSRIIDAMDLKTQENALNQEISEISQKHKACEKKNKELEKEKDAIFKDIEEKKEKIRQDLEEERNLRVEVEYREKISQGAVFTEKIESMENEIKENGIRLGENRREIQELEKKSKVLNEKKAFIETGIREYAQKSSAYENERPGTREALQGYRDEANRIRNLYEKQTGLKESIKNKTKNIDTLTESLDQKSRARKMLAQEAETLKKDITALENENLGAKLRDQLLPGEPCPVCGSKDHPIKNSRLMNEDADKLKELKNEQLEKENILGVLITEISELTGRLKAEINYRLTQETDLMNLGETIEDGCPEALENKNAALGRAIETWENRQKEREAAHNKCEQDLIAVTGDIKEKTAEQSALNKQIDEMQKENEEKEEALRTLKKELEKLSAAIAVTDFMGESKRIRSMDTRRNELVLSMENRQTVLEKNQKKLEALNDAITELKGQIREYAFIGLEKKKQSQEKQKIIIARVGEDQDLSRLGVLRTKQENSIHRINAVWAEQKKEREALQEAYEKVQKLVTAHTASLDTLMRQCSQNEQSLNKQLSALGFEDREEAKRAYRSQETMDALETAIKDFYEALAKNKGALESLNKKVNGRELSLEKYTEIKEKQEWHKNHLGVLKDQETRLEDEVKHLTRRLDELQGFFIEKEKLDHHLALITDLEKLFSGKKFVEFVAVERLKYISIEASKRLMEISNGNYGLEADADGRFIIRDYKNGGASRDPSTLSGGETFLASLSLALALSAEIQLKGRAPLEFFFLDEGFGSLHEDALEDVMNSIEMLHHDKLKVGIISHVESIKNRMPVKLLITPAEAGAGGSRVRIEK